MATPTPAHTRAASTNERAASCDALCQAEMVLECATHPDDLARAHALATIALVHAVRDLAD